MISQKERELKIKEIQSKINTLKLDLAKLNSNSSQYLLKIGEVGFLYAELAKHQKKYLVTFTANGSLLEREIFLAKECNVDTKNSTPESLLSNAGYLELLEELNIFLKSKYDNSYSIENIKSF